MPYPKMKNLLALSNKVPGPVTAPVMTPPKVPMSAPVKPAFASPGMPSVPKTHMTVPSLQATSNEAVPIELGDPKRLSKIATILRMGRK